MKKVNYTLDDTRYWTCPECNTINDTDVLDGIDMFPECEDCGKIFRWGVEEEIIEDKKTPKKPKDSIIREIEIDDSKMDYKKLTKLLKKEIKLTKIEMITELKSNRYYEVIVLKSQLDTYNYILNKAIMGE